MRLGTVLFAYRENARPRIGLRSLAREIGVSASTLSRIENGAEPDPQSMNAIWGWLTRPDQ